jgi:sugar/nucleoside kinase (ribokinase family)
VFASIGDVLLDVVVVLRADPTDDDDTPAAIRLGGGGQAANFCAWAQKLGEPSRLVSRVGKDDSGRRLIADLKARGVDCCVLNASEPTGIVVAYVRRDGKRSFATQRGASVGLEPDDLKQSWFEGIRLLHLPAYSLFREPLASAARRAHQYVREAGGSLAMDLSSAAGLQEYGAERMLGELNQLKPEFLFGNQREFDVLGSSPDALAKTAVVKMGRQGCRVAGSHVPAPGVAEVDPTGAGDAFAAAFCLASLNGASHVESARRAVEVAANAVGKVGVWP